MGLRRLTSYEASTKQVVAQILPDALLDFRCDLASASTVVHEFSCLRHWMRGSFSLLSAASVPWRPSSGYVEIIFFGRVYFLSLMSNGSLIASLSFSKSAKATMGSKDSSTMTAMLCGCRGSLWRQRGEVHPSAPSHLKRLCKRPIS